jgi:hypothetical protein
MDIKMIDLDKADRNTSDINSPRLDTMSENKKTNLLPVVVTFIVVVIAGFYSGAWLKTSGTSKLVGGSDAKNIQAQIPATGVKVGDIYGSADEKAFKDSATGVLDKGGFNGEGTHKLVRPGGVSQTVYLTSSVIDLDSLVGSQVTVWGETFKGQKTGWLMDVGRAKVENLNVPLPK